MALLNGWAASNPLAVSVAIFAAGCFWGVEERFRTTPGVQATAVGYVGGDFPHPTYHDVCQGVTGHAEAVRLHFDPAQISFSQLLDLFWTLHDPTQLNRQGPDIGSQYRSAVFCQDEEQLQTALASRRAAQTRFSRPIVTQILPAGSFWLAEDYHQQYLVKNPHRLC